MPREEKVMVTTTLDYRLTRDVYQLNLTDADNAEAFALVYGDRLRYVHGIGWHIWNGTYWQPDETKEVMQLVRELSKYRQIAITEFETDHDTKLKKWRTALKMEQTPGAKSCLEFAQSLNYICIGWKHLVLCRRIK